MEIEPLAEIGWLDHLVLAVVAAAAVGGVGGVAGVVAAAAVGVAGVVAAAAVGGAGGVVGVAAEVGMEVGCTGWLVHTSVDRMSVVAGVQVACSLVDRLEPGVLAGIAAGSGGSGCWTWVDGLVASEGAGPQVVVRTIHWGHPGIHS